MMIFFTINMFFLLTNCSAISTEESQLVAAAAAMESEATAVSTNPPSQITTASNDPSAGISDPLSAENDAQCKTSVITFH